MVSGYLALLLCRILPVALPLLPGKTDDDKFDRLVESLRSLLDLQTMLRREMAIDVEQDGTVQFAIDDLLTRRSQHDRKSQ
jgi:hypothetical protein